jgi:hypothetical protein
LIVLLIFKGLVIAGLGYKLTKNKISNNKKNKDKIKLMAVASEKN